jgi:hypothetical protein
MPVFTFEKIPSPIRHASSTQPAAEKPRSVIIQFLDRFVEARVKRSVVDENAGQSEQGKPQK